jgi:hypothetical protein
MKLFFKILLLQIAFCLFWPMSAQAAPPDPVEVIRFADAGKTAMPRPMSVMQICCFDDQAIPLIDARQSVRAWADKPLVRFIAAPKQALLKDWRGYKDDPHIA